MTMFPLPVTDISQDINGVPNYEIICAVLTLYVYDYLLSFHDEITYIWSWRTGKVTYVFSRGACIGYAISLLIEANCKSRTVCFYPSLQGSVIYYVIYSLMTLVYLSSQVIFGARIYALYGNRRLHLIALIFICFVAPVFVAIIEIARGPSFFGTRTAQILTLNVFAFTTDGAFLILILVHAFKSRSLLRFRFAPKTQLFQWASLGNIVDSGTGLLSLLVSDSIIYYSTTLTMYLATFLAYRLTPLTTPVGAGLLSLTSIWMGVMAPKLLLSTRKEYYSGMFGDSLDLCAPFTISWMVDGPTKDDVSTIFVTETAGSPAHS